MRRLLILKLGLMEYGEALTLQRALAQARLENRVGDLLLLLEHPPTITLGRSGRRQHLLVGEEVLEARGIGLYEVERGGDVTYHGPGQLVGYPILDLNFYGRDIRLYVRRLEEVLILTMQEFGIQAERRDLFPGVWLGSKKIASLGLRIRRWVSWHGFALNVNVDLSHFDLIVPCGLPGIEVTSMAEVLGRTIPMEAVQESVSDCFQRVFLTKVEQCPLENLGLPLSPILSKSFI